MKKLIHTLREAIALTVMLMLTLSTFAQTFHVSGNRAKFNAPEGITDDSEILFPTWDASQAAVDATNDTVSISVNQFYTFVTTDSLTADAKVIVETEDYVTAGAILYLVAWSDTCTFGAGFITSPSLPLAANKKKVIQFVYNGTSWYPTGTAIQLN